MRLLKTLSVFCSAIITLFMICACAPTEKSEGTGGYIDDMVITTKVKIALLREKSITSREIGVKTFKGRVQLSGFLTSNNDAIRAVKTARNVAGVQSVENMMQLK